VKYTLVRSMQEQEREHEREQQQEQVAGRNVI